MADVDLSQIPTDQLMAMLQAHPAVAAPAPQQSTFDAINQGVGNQINDFVAATGHHVMSGFHGLAQLIENGAAAGANYVAPDSSVAKALTDNANQVNAALKQREADYQASTPNSAGAYAGAATGEILPLVATGAGRALSAAGDYLPNLATRAFGLGAPATGAIPLASKVANTVGKVASGATQGAILGASSPVTGEGDYWGQKGDQVTTGAAIGGAVPAGLSVASGAAELAKPIVAPTAYAADAIKNWLGDDLPNVVQNIKTANTAPLVPGSQPTVPQLAKNYDLLQVAKALDNNPATKGTFAEQEAANNSARWNVINGLAGDDATLKAAIDARRAGALATLDPSGQSPTIEHFLRTQAPADAAPVLATISTTLDSSAGQNPTVRKGLADLKNQILSNMDKDGYVRPDLLEGIRQNAGQFLADNAPNGAVSNVATVALSPVKSALENAITGSVPGFPGYLAKYAELSAPINTMEAAQGMADRLGSRSLGSGGLPQLTLTGYNSALAQALKGAAPHGIDPAAQQALEGVQQDLQRASISNSVRASGSDTSYNLQAPGWLGNQLYGPGFSGAGKIPRALGAALGYHIHPTLEGAGAGYFAAKKIGDLANSRTSNALAELLSDPQKFLDAIQPSAPGPLNRFAQSPAGQTVMRQIPQISPILMNRQQALAAQLSNP